MKKSTTGGVTFEASIHQNDKNESPRYFSCAAAGSRSNTIWHGYHEAYFGDLDFGHAPSILR